MNRKILIVLLIISMFVVGNVSAQEVEVQPTNGVLGIDRDVFIGVCVMLGIVLQGVLLAYVNKTPQFLFESYKQLLQDKAVRDAAERAYFESSLPVQEFIKIIKAGVVTVSGLDINVVDEFADPLADFIEDITDGDIEDDEPSAYIYKDVPE